MKKIILDKFNEVMEKIDYSNFLDNCKFIINQVKISKHQIYMYIQKVFKDDDLKFRSYHLRFDNLKLLLSISSYTPKVKHYFKNI